MIHDYSRFRVETIDSFFQSVMRNLARELELGANLNIELNNMEVLSDAVDSMIEKLDRQSPVLYWLLEYIEERIADDKRWNVSGEIKNFGRNIFDEGYIEKGNGLREKITGQRLYQELPRNAASHFGRGAGTNERICRPILRNIGYKRGESRRFEKRFPRYSRLFNKLQSGN